MKTELGTKVRDRVTGLVGVVIGRTEWLNGCATVGVRPPLDKDGKMVDTQWIDEPQIEVLLAKPVLTITEKSGGGPIPSTPTRNTRGAA